MKQRCRHNKLWIFASKLTNGVSWCYECGAIRLNMPGEKWQKPVGIGGENPALKGIKK